MKVEQLYTGCLAEAAYYIESDGEAAIIDPLRETEPYLELLRRDDAQLKYVFETHFHADFVSGHLDLAKKTGATIVLGPTAQPAYPAHIASDGEEFPIGKITIVAIHTPGHTLESTTYLLKDASGKPVAIFTGDTLFIGDVGRPDLAVKSNLTKEDLAGMLYDSLHRKILPLPDDIIIYPGHGKGSACGKNMSDQTYDTLGHQKQVNYALQARSKEEFIKEVLEGLMPPPQYFPKNAVLNKMGPKKSIDEVLAQGAVGLTPDAFEQRIQKEGAIVIDARSPHDFAQGHIPGAINIGLDGEFAPWVGTLIPDLNQLIVLVTPIGREKEAVVRLARVGYDNAYGYLEGGMNAWENAGKPIESVPAISAAKLADVYRQHPAHTYILDVRRPPEYQSEHIKGVTNYPLDFIQQWQSELNPNETYYLHCVSGYRSMIAASLLRKAGFRSVINVEGGFNELRQTGIPLTGQAVPSEG